MWGRMALLVPGRSGPWQAADGNAASLIDPRLGEGLTVLGVERKMRSIGEMARDSGLSVSALRFYDGAGVLAPAWVDPESGYRWYGPEQLEESQLLARLRRAGMPLADI